MQYKIHRWLLKVAHLQNCSVYPICMFIVNYDDALLHLLMESNILSVTTVHHKTIKNIDVIQFL